MHCACIFLCELLKHSAFYQILLKLSLVQPILFHGNNSQHIYVVQDIFWTFKGLLHFRKCYTANQNVWDYLHVLLLFCPMIQDKRQKVKLLNPILRSWSLSHIFEPDPWQRMVNISVNEPREKQENSRRRMCPIKNNRSKTLVPCSEPKILCLMPNLLVLFHCVAFSVSSTFHMGNLNKNVNGVKRSF